MQIAMNQKTNDKKERKEKTIKKILVPTWKRVVAWVLRGMGSVLEEGLRAGQGCPRREKISS
jgi:hypothetical protein